MSVEKFELILYDQLTEWRSSRFKYKDEFRRISYSTWAVEELERYVVQRLYPLKTARIKTFIEIIKDFYKILVSYSKIHQFNNSMFIIASDVVKDVLEILQAME